jgi:manganese efflux pump family protein
VPALLLLAVASGLSNLGAAVGIGLSGVSTGVRARVAVVFGLFEAAMPVLGVALGHGLAASFGQLARWLGAAVLITAGMVSLMRARRAPAPDQAPADQGRPWRTGRVTASGLALSADNLAAGFALGAYQVGLAVTAAVFGAVSVAMSLAGLELGAKIGAAAAGRSELLASAILIGVGAVLAAGVP